MKYSQGNIVLIGLVVLHILLGVASALSPPIAKLWGAAPILLGAYFIIKNRNQNDEAVYWASYYGALEVLLRVTGGTLGYEMGKYSLILFLLLGKLLNQGEKRNNVWILFLILLTLGVTMTEWTTNNISELVRFALSGPILLAVSAYYFIGREFTWVDYKKILRNIILPIMALTVVLIIKTPDLSTINFRSQSNLATSGGFGPVHVSSILGLGLIILMVNILIKQVILQYRWIEIVAWILILYRALLTFSRSGIYAAAAVGLLIILSLFSEKKLRLQMKRYIIWSLFAIVFVFGVWNKVNTVTGGMAYNRFTGRNSVGTKLQDVTSNRKLLLKQELELFYKNPVLGIGVGMTTVVRKQVFNNSASSHTEYTRLLAEHGTIGVFLLVILLLAPLLHYRETEGLTKLFFVLFAGYSLIIMFPASTRTALPLFIYGLSFVKIIED